MKKGSRDVGSQFEHIEKYIAAKHEEVRQEMQLRRVLDVLKLVNCSLLQKSSGKRLKRHVPPKLFNKKETK